MNLKGKKVLITGSRGFVGKHLVKRLKKEGASIITFEDNLNKNKEKSKDIADWKDFKDIKDEKTKIDLVYHLAAITFIPRSIEDPELTKKTNIIGTKNILKLCKLKVAKLIFPSSYVYGTPKYIPIDENHPLKANNPYTKSKIEGEKLCEHYYKKHGTKSIILRFFNVYGPGQRKDFLIPTIIDQIKEKNTGSVRLMNLKPKRDFLFVKDVIDAYIKAAQYEKTGFDIFNIGSGESYSVEYIAEKLIGLSKKEMIFLSTDKKRCDTTPNAVADIKKAKALLRWEPKTNLENGLKKTLQLY